MCQAWCFAACDTSSKHGRELPPASLPENLSCSPYWLSVYTLSRRFGVQKWDFFCLSQTKLAWFRCYVGRRSLLVRNLIGKRYCFRSTVHRRWFYAVGGGGVHVVVALWWWDQANSAKELGYNVWASECSISKSPLMCWCVFVDTN